MQSFVSEQELKSTFLERHGPVERHGWSPRMKASFGYYSPDVYYETVVSKLVYLSTRWIDLGCGSDIFPSNLATAERLAARAKLLVGVDPSENVHMNRLVHVKVQGMLSDVRSADSFDLVTMRMVAEHVEHPEALIRDITRLTGAGSRVVVYTVSLWSIVTAVSALVPFSLHHPIKRILWRTKEQDTFPVAYKMNTRKQLRSLFEQHGFEEEYFSYLGDCRSLARWRPTHFLELSLWKLLRAVGLPYPENCILGVFRRSQ